MKDDTIISMIRIMIDIDSLDQLPQMSDIVAAAKFVEKLHRVAVHLLNGENGIIEDEDGAPEMHVTFVENVV